MDERGHRGSGLTYRAAGKGLGVRARDCCGEIPGEDSGGALRDGAEEGDDGVGPPVSGRGARDAGRALASGVTRGRADVRAQAVRVRGRGAGPRGGRAEAGCSVGRAEPGQAGGERAGEERELGRVVRVKAGPSGETNWAWVCFGPGSGVGWVSWAGFGFEFCFGFSFYFSFSISKPNKV